MKKTVVPILIAAVWISISEFFRNTCLLHHYWTVHYQNSGMIFPEQPVNGAVWGLWSLCLAIAIFIWSKKYTLVETVMISWFAGFALMWLAIGNLGVLPFGILPYAIPLSWLEVWLASLIIFKFSDKNQS